MVLPDLGEPVDELWSVFLDLGERLPADWTIVGGQMVLLHALENGVGGAPRRPARLCDGDQLRRRCVPGHGRRRGVATALTPMGLSTNPCGHPVGPEPSAYPSRAASWVTVTHFERRHSPVTPQHPAGGAQTRQKRRAGHCRQVKDVPALPDRGERTPSCPPEFRLTPSQGRCTLEHTFDAPC